jgi:hypothetical protein
VTARLLTSATNRPSTGVRPIQDASGANRSSGKMIAIDQSACAIGIPLRS